MKTPHKHADLIHAWAEGAEIESRVNEIEWEVVDKPRWLVDYEYRLKPEPKPDVVLYCRIYEKCTGALTRIRFDSDNLKLTFDGETGKLKSTEVIS